MDHMILYRIICEKSAEKNGRAVEIKPIMIDPAINRWSQSKFYRVLRELIRLGFISKNRNGVYRPVDIYQWHMEDYGKNAS